MTLFQRALPFFDSKKLHLALLGLYEGTEWQDRADDVYITITKKFNGTAKVAGEEDGGGLFFGVQLDKTILIHLKK